MTCAPAFEPFYGATFVKVSVSVASTSRYCGPSTRSICSLGDSSEHHSPNGAFVAHPSTLTLLATLAVAHPHLAGDSTATSRCITRQPTKMHGAGSDKHRWQNKRPGVGHSECRLRCFPRRCP